MEEEWVQSLRRQCRQQKVRFFFEQWGGVNKKANGRMLNGRTYDELPILQ
jgi:protein gp37